MSSEQSDSPLVEPRIVPSERPGPEGGKRAENRRRRTEALSRAALELFLEHGVEAVTIDQIATAAGVAKGSFYRYFRSKDDLVDALIQTIAEPLREALERCAADLRRASQIDLANAYQRLAFDFASIVLANQDIARLYLQENRGPEVGARAPIVRLSRFITQQAFVLTDVATEHGLLRPLNPKVSALSVVGAAERLLHAWLSGEDVGDALETARSLISLVLEGLRPGSSD